MIRTTRVERLSSGREAGATHPTAGVGDLNEAAICKLFGERET